MQQESWWFNKIEARDFFGSTLQNKAREALAECRTELEVLLEKI